MIGLIVVLLKPFSRVVSSSLVLILVLLGFKDKIMLHCLREVKCQQIYNPGI